MSVDEGLVFQAIMFAVISGAIIPAIYLFLKALAGKEFLVELRPVRGHLPEKRPPGRPEEPRKAA